MPTEQRQPILSLCRVSFGIAVVAAVCAITPSRAQTPCTGAAGPWATCPQWTGPELSQFATGVPNDYAYDPLDAFSLSGGGLAGFAQLSGITPYIATSTGAAFSSSSVNAAGAHEVSSLAVSPGLSGQYNVAHSGLLAANTLPGKIVQGVATVATDAVGQVPIAEAEIGSEGLNTPAIPAEEIWVTARGRAVGKAAGDVADSAAEVGGKLASNVAKSIRSYEKQIASHLEKLARFRTNPTVRPGMEHLPEETIRAAQQSRIEHLEREIRAFEGNIAKLLGGS